MSSRSGARQSHAGRGFDPVHGFRDAAVPRAMGATIEPAIRLDPVSDDPTLAVIACRCEDMNRALETIENMCAAVLRSDFERLVVRVAAEFAGSHDVYPLFEIHWVLPASGKTKRRIW